VFFVLVFCAISTLPCAAASAQLLRTIFNCIGECINTFSCIGKTNNFKPPDIILAAFSAAAEASSRT
jgi:hypothetical protein